MYTGKLWYDDSRDLHEGMIGLKDDDGNAYQVGHILPDFREEYGKLIVSAVNACISINKNNPMAVADGMGKVVGAADAFLEWFRTQGYNRETPQYRVLDHAVRDIKSQDRGEIE